jgi:hypothetical protein
MAPLYDVNKEIQGSPLSPFAAAIIAGNTKLAQWFLEQEKGIANFSNLLLERLPAGLLEWNGSLIKELDIRHNRLNLLPASLRHIEKVHVEGNPLLCFPIALRTAKWPKCVISFFGIPGLTRDTKDSRIS